MTKSLMENQDHLKVFVQSQGEEMPRLWIHLQATDPDEQVLS